MEVVQFPRTLSPIVTLCNEASSGAQRNWVMERLEAVCRYESQTGSDYESHLMMNTYRHCQRGTPINIIPYTPIFGF